MNYPKRRKRKPKLAHCRNGHNLECAGVYIRKSEKGYLFRICKACHKKRVERYDQKRKHSLDRKQKK